MQALEREEGGSPLTAQPPVFDGVQLKNIDPGVVLGMLIAAISRNHPQATGP